MNRIKELEAENEDLRKRLQDAYYLIGMKPENMSLRQLIWWQSSQLSKKGYFWWAAKMAMGAAGFVMTVMVIFALVSLITGHSSITCNAG